MANTTATIVAGYGHGTRSVQAYHKVGRPLPLIDLFCGLYEVPAGQAAIQIPLEGAALTNATAAEEDAAATAQALNALTLATLTPGSYVSATALTTQALNRVDPGIVDLRKLSEDEIVYPHRRTIAYDTSIGVVYARFAGLSNIIGTAGATLTPSVLADAYEALCEGLSQHVVAICWLNTKQWADLVRYILTTSGTAYAQNPMFLDLLKGMGLQTNAYMGSIGPIHIFVDPDPNGFQQISSNDRGAMFVPAFPGLNGWPLANEVAGRYDGLSQVLPGGLPLAPAFAIGYRANPAAAPIAMSLPTGASRRVLTAGGIPIDVIPRMYVGQNLGAIDAWSDVATVEVNDASGVGIRSVH